jgi:hypothetical protein
MSNPFLLTIASVKQDLNVSFIELNTCGLNILTQIQCNF